MAVCAGCNDQAAPKQRDPFAYDRDRPLRPVVVHRARRKSVRVARITYVAADGQRVPALFAVPRVQEPQGCLIYQGGLGTKKEAAAPLWPGLAALGLATFTIDPRYTGARATKAKPLARVVRSADRIVAMLHDDVVDLRRGIDYLEGRPECRRNIGYLGTSMGAVLGAALAGGDDRVHATILTSVGATFREGLLYAGDVLLPGIAGRPRELEAAVRKFRPFDAARWVAKIGPRPVMIVNGRRDPRVPVVDALNLAAAARDPKTVVFHKGGHDPFAPPYGDAVIRRVANFLVTELAEYRTG
jgi:pimeloyl-ACP methyl ester carboxylesterase